MNEAETRAELIDPQLKACGWGVVAGSKILRERDVCQITAGRIQVGGGRGKALIADYILVYKGIKLAVVEAKSEDLDVREGVQQAKQYAEKLNLATTYATNGKAIYQICMQTGAEGLVADFLTPDEMWNKTHPKESGSELASTWWDKFASIPFENKSGTWQPRYYQEIAIRNTLQAIAQGKDRILLTLATGTGKTAIAFQIAWVLFHTRWNLSVNEKWNAENEGSGYQSRRPRILFLADRNILADQAFNAFSAFDEDAMVRIKPTEIKKKGQVPTNGSIFFTIFQSFMATSVDNGAVKANDNNCQFSTGNSQLNFGQYPADFFDFIIVDECHRGGANDEVIAGKVERGKIYQETDFNKIIEIEAREKNRVQIFMDAAHENEKTIIFCANQAHAALIRDLVNQCKRQYTNSTEPNYCVRVTANDGETGEQFLRQFQDNEKSLPTILTTSQKLSTGVDALNIRNIVLMRPIKQIIEFKQIIGRGTRLYDGKEFFTIYDFVDAYQRFSDPEWDGEPVEGEPCEVCGQMPCICVYEPPRICSVCGKTPCSCFKEPPPPCYQCGQSPCVCNKKIKIKLADGKEREIQYIMATSFWDAGGTPISAEEFLHNIFGSLPDFFKDEAELRLLWSAPTTRKTLLEKLDTAGFDKTALAALQKLIDAEKSDLFDVLEYVFNSDIKPKTRKARVAAAKSTIHALLNEQQKEFIDFVLRQYIESGIDELALGKLPELLKIKYQSLADAERILGKAEDIQSLFSGFQKHLYRKAA